MKGSKGKRVLMGMAILLVVGCLLASTAPFSVSHGKVPAFTTVEAPGTPTLETKDIDENFWDWSNHTSGITQSPLFPELPSRFNWNEERVIYPSVKSQGDRSTGWTFAAVSMVQYAKQIFSDKRWEFSVEDVMADDTPDSVPLILEKMTTQGITDDSTGETCQIASWHFVPKGDKNTTLVKYLIHNFGPVFATVYATQDFENYTGGVYDQNEDGKVNHAVLLIGWDDQKGKNGAWLVQNSWGTDWGENGYMWIEFGSQRIAQTAVYVTFAGWPHGLAPLHPLFDPSQAEASTRATPGEEIVALAVHEEGRGPEEVGQDLGYYPYDLGRYLDPGEAWCSEFVSWVYKAAGYPLTGGSEGGWMLRDSYALKRWYQDRGLWVQKGSSAWQTFVPEAGDYVRYQFTSDGHSGIARYVSGSTLYTVEGNVSNLVKLRSLADWRNYSTLDGIGYRNLTPPTPTPTATDTPTRTPTGVPPTPTPTTPPGNVVFFDDFETSQGWTTDPNGNDTATTGLWERANPETTEYSGVTYQLGTTVSGSYDLVTEGSAGSSVGSYDIDGGDTTVRSPNITLPGSGDVTLSFSYYLAHYSNATSDDYLRVKVVGSTTQTVFEELGAGNTDGAAWDTFSTSLNAFAGQTVYLLVEAADGGGGSLVEAAVDDVLVESSEVPPPTPTPTGVPPTPTPTGVPPTPTPTSGPGVVFFDDFESSQGWVVNPNGNDTATTGLWERANPEGTEYSGVTYQLGTTVSGSYDLVTEGSAGSSVGSYDIDGGDTTVRSPNITLPSSGDVTLSFSYYLAHYSNATSDDYLRVKVVGSTTQTVFEELGAGNTDGAAWDTFSTSLNDFRGQTVYLLIEAADGGGGSLVEAAIDDVLIESN